MNLETLTCRVTFETFIELIEKSHQCDVHILLQYSSFVHSELHTYGV